MNAIKIFASTRAMPCTDNVRLLRSSAIARDVQGFAQAA
jgi:hypothetical protein